MLARVHFIYHRIGHHSDHSGYDQLVKYIPHTDIKPSWLGRYAEGMDAERLDQWIKGAPLIWYSKQKLVMEADAAWLFFKTTRHIYHYLYGEDFYYYLSKIPNLMRNRIVVSYHQPPSFFPKAVLRTDHVKKADAIITVSKKQKEYFSEIVGEDRVFFVPHGVDTEFFHPPPLNPLPHETKRCLFVGHWLRDIDTLVNVIRAFQSRGITNVRFIIVTFEKHFEKFRDLKQVDLLTGVSADDLLRLYQTCDLLYLPLLDSTANNTILEAMACGLPIVTTDVGGVRDYVDEKSTVLLPQGNVDAAVGTLSELLWNSDRLSDLSSYARQRATGFNWPIVASKMLEVYERITNG